MFDSFFSRHWFSERAKAIWSDRATLQAWLDVEAALAQAQAELGIVPAEAAQIIAANSRAELFDLDELAAEIVRAQHPFVPVLKRFEAICGDPAASFIHWGATTQNIFDTAAALQLRRSHALLMEQRRASGAAMARLAARYRDVPQAGRTHGQHALPMTFGFKVAGWLDEVRRHRARLAAQESRSFVAALGGAIGTFAAMARPRTGRAGPRGRAFWASRRPPCRCARRSIVAPSTSAPSGCSPARRRRSRTGSLHAAHGDRRSRGGRRTSGKVGSSTMAQKRNPSVAVQPDRAGADGCARECLWRSS